MDRLGPYELNTIVTGDARELAEAIPDESIDLIFTDPEYDKIEDYEWLARTAARVLKPKGTLLCWSNGKWHYHNTRWLDAPPLCYQWTFAVVTSKNSAPMDGKVIAKTNRVIWFNFGNGRNMIDYLADGYLDIAGVWQIPKGSHQWNKSDAFTIKAMRAFAQPGDIVADFFCGGGTTCAVAKMLNLDYWACEIEPETAARARERVLLTQPPLFVMPELEQLELLSLQDGPPLLGPGG